MPRLARLREIVARTCGVQVCGKMFRGIDPLLDIRNSLELEIATVFDVGAHWGLSAVRYLRWFPRCQVHCFEPVTENFVRLRRRFERQPRIHCHQLAMGERRKESLILVPVSRDRSRLVGLKTDPSLRQNATLEKVSIETIDRFCREVGLERIGYLKIDTEGNDLNVLRGAAKMLSRQRIDIVEVEAGMNPGNRTHVPFEEFKTLLERYGYLLFGIYEQFPELMAGKPNLRRTNPVFIAARGSGPRPRRSHRRLETGSVE